MTRAFAAAIALALLASSPALAASRPRYGGSLRIALAGAQVAAPEVNRPEAAAISALRFPAVCRLDPVRGVVPVLADISRPRSNGVTVTPRSATIRAATVAAQWTALVEPASPYRALFAPLRGEGRTLAQQVSGNTVDLALQFPWPDLEATLCHPALGLRGPWAYAESQTPGAFDAHLGFPEGRPFPDRLQLLAGDERRSSRLFATGQADLVLGARPRDSGEPPAGFAALFATYLVYRPARVGPHLRAVIDDAVDPRELVQHFLSVPAAPMPQLLPPPWMADLQPLAPTALKGDPTKELVLLYDAVMDEHRAVAERIQVRLHDRGFRIALKPVSSVELRVRWAKGDYDLLLWSLLLPPVPAAALALVIELGGRHDLLAVELSAMGALPDAAARQARAAERAKALRSVLPVVPLYTRAPQLMVSGKVQGLRADAFGLPMLDQLFLSVE